MRRILLTIEYYGKKFCGWQIQKNGPSIQEEIKRAIKEVTGEDVVLEGSGRTDAGVNAINQTAHFDTKSSLPIHAFVPALNNILKTDIQIKSSCEVSSNFHARYSAVKKTYIYKMYVSKTASPLKDLFAMQVTFDTLDMKGMNRACKFLKGEHDFTSFKSCRSKKENNIRTIYSARVYKNGDILEFKICGNGFLHNMVRIIVGTLIDVGVKKLKPEDIKKIIEDKNRASASETAAAHGLYLQSVEY